MSIRTHTRQIIVQCIYDWHFSKKPFQELIAEHTVDKKPKSIDVLFLNSSLAMITDTTEELDATVIKYAKRDLNDISPMELAILRLGIYEIIYRNDIPFKVTISECLDLAHRFGSSESHRFINKVLDLAAEANP